MRFDDEQLTGNDEEPFELDALDNWKLQFELTERMKRWVERDWDAEGLPVQLQAQVERLRRQGRLPLAAFGEFSARHLLQPLPDLLWRYRQEIERWPEAVEQQQELRHRHPSGLELEDWLGGLRRDASGRLARLQLLSGKLHEGRSFKWHSLVRHWLQHLALQRLGQPVRSVLVSQTGTLEIPPLPSERAGEYLDQLIDAWRQGMRQPLPLACRTAFAWLASGGAAEPESHARGAQALRGGFGMGARWTPRRRWLGSIRTSTGCSPAVSSRTGPSSSTRRCWLPWGVARRSRHEPAADARGPRSAGLPVARQPPDRGQRRYRQDVHHRPAIRTPGPRPWRRAAGR